MDNKHTPKLKALLLVGGFGTRLRPLTLTKAKPLIEFINKPILCHQIEALKTVGVDEIVLAINYHPEQMYCYISELEKQYDIKITCSLEKEPLGTAGPIGLAKDILNRSEGEDIFVFNADITCRFPLKEMLQFHRTHGREGTIAVTKVKDPSKYGVITTDENNKIISFVEKPTEFVGDNINAGLYVFNKRFLNRVEARPCSIEREVFPKMAKDGELYVFNLEGFWADIGQHREYLNATKLFLNDLKETNKLPTDKKSNIEGNVLIDPTAIIDDNCLIGPNVVIGPNVTVKAGARIKNTVIFSNVTVEESAFVEGSIIGWRSHIGKWARIESMSILGEEVKVSNEIYINGAIILPHLPIKTSLPKEGSIVLF